MTRPAFPMHQIADLRCLPLEITPARPGNDTFANRKAGEEPIDMATLKRTMREFGVDSGAHYQPWGREFIGPFRERAETETKEKT